MISSIKTLWDFARPHTIIGSWLSITALFGICSTGGTWDIALYLMVLIGALACNVYITGLNQLYDVAIDRISKPFLPLVDGRLSMRAGRWIITTSLTIMCIAGFFADIRLLVLLLLIATIGMLYSVPPIRLKKHHLPASLCIVVVRGLLVNLGIGWILADILKSPPSSYAVLIALTLFMTIFSFAIAWLKDLYDMEADQEHEVKTLALLYSVTTAFKASVAAIFLAYSVNAFIGYYALFDDVFLSFHLIALIIFLTIVARANLSSREGMYTFYMTIWVLFFVEYLFMIVWYGIL